MSSGTHGSFHKHYNLATKQSGVQPKTASQRRQKVDGCGLWMIVQVREKISYIRKFAVNCNDSVLDIKEQVAKSIKKPVEHLHFGGYPDYAYVRDLLHDERNQWIMYANENDGDEEKTKSKRSHSHKAHERDDGDDSDDHCNSDSEKEDGDEDDNSGDKRGHNRNVLVMPCILADPEENPMVVLDYSEKKQDTYVVQPELKDLHAKSAKKTQQKEEMFPMLQEELRDWKNKCKEWEKKSKALERQILEKQHALDRFVKEKELELKQLEKEHNWRVTKLDNEVDATYQSQKFWEERTVSLEKKLRRCELQNARQKRELEKLKLRSSSSSSSNEQEELSV